MQKNQSIYVVILNWNGLAMTRECLHSFSFVTRRHKIIVVDNGSTDGSALKLKGEFPEHLVIENSHNLGYAAGNNVGIKQALKENADYILVLNNDTAVCPDCLDALVEQDKALKHESIIGSAIINYYSRDELDHLGGIWNDKKNNFDLIGAKAPLSHLPRLAKTPLDYIMGCALFAKGSTFSKIGLFNPQYFLFWEEVDWCYRAKKLNIGLTICAQSLIYHKGSASFQGNSPHKEYFWWRSRLLWMDKNIPSSTYAIRPEIVKTARHFLLLHMQRVGYALLLNTKGARHKTAQIKRKKAALRGMVDYCLSRFGPPPKNVLSK
ncbi:hypothetical protein COB21_06035 [Candidatus Aerophobetes bacterium]|uniref:Glycosyltransferase 2-like domain-containing protein n=1 Tax=Aerophobetes bacterium TaxID=2030807 RepID=A0A2A4WXH1_UNCAE|nr:MAG: hypothetical protein COB21_06035 [Candidatus Aerophobetes bacterium]